MDTVDLRAFFQKSMLECDFGFGVASKRSSCQSGLPENFDDVSGPRFWISEKASTFDADPIYSYINKMGDPDPPSPISIEPPSASRDLYSVSSPAKSITPSTALLTPSSRDIASRFNTHEDKGHYCTYLGCSKSYTRAQDLRRHYLCHINKTAYYCFVLGCKRGKENGFRRKDHLRDHLRKVHGMRCQPTYESMMYDTNRIDR